MIAETQRLILRELAAEDAPDLFRIYSDPSVMRFMGTPPASVERERAGIKAHVRDYYTRLGFGLWAVVQKSSGAVIGRCGLLQHELKGRPQVEISYLLDRPYWGHGYAAEAASAVVQLAFDRLRMDRLIALIAPANTASSRVAERLGFRLEGEVEYKNFGVVDLYALNREAPMDGCPRSARP